MHCDFFLDGKGDFVMKKRIGRVAILILGVFFFLGTPINTVAESYQSETEYIDSKMPTSQRFLVHKYANEYCICEELLQSLIFCESSYQMSATNPTTGCYGICQINPNVWGYGCDTEEKQIKKCCEMLIGFLEEEPDIAYALARYNGQSDAYEDYLLGLNTENEFVSKVLRISEELERLHGKMDYERGLHIEKP